MSTTERLYENLLVITALLIMSLFMVTVIGYFDEGHYRIYGSFGNYLSQGGYPPFSDYALWFVLSSVIGLVVFNVISNMGEKQAPLSWRLATTVMTVPALFFAVIFILSKTIS